MYYVLNTFISPYIMNTHYSINVLYILFNINIYFYRAKALRLCLLWYYICICNFMLCYAKREALSDMPKYAIWHTTKFIWRPQVYPFPLLFFETIIQNINLKTKTTTFVSVAFVPKTSSMSQMTVSEVIYVPHLGQEMLGLSVTTDFNLFSLIQCIYIYIRNQPLSYK